MDSFTDIVIRLRWLIIIGFVGITAAFASQVPNAEVESSIKAMLPDDVKSVLDLDAIEELFGGTEMIMLAITADDVLDGDTLRQVRKLSRKLERTKKVDRVLSLFTLKEIRSEDGEMIVESAILRIPKDDAERASLRQRLKDNDMIYGNVVSKNFEATAVIGLLNKEANDEQITGGGAPGAPGIPADPGGNAGSGGTGVAGPDQNTNVHPHRGVVGDLDPAGGPSDLVAGTHGWSNPVAKVVVSVGGHH